MGCEFILLFSSISCCMRKRTFKYSTSLDTCSAILHIWVARRSRDGEMERGRLGNGWERRGGKDWFLIQLLGSPWRFICCEEPENNHSKLSSSWQIFESWGFSADCACPFIMCLVFQHQAISLTWEQLLSINKPSCNHPLFITTWRLLYAQMRA